MDSKMNERLLSKIHLDRLLSDESRKEELISIVAFYFAQKDMLLECNIGSTSTINKYNKREKK